MCIRDGQYLIDKGVLGRSFEKTMYVTFLASAFRSIRFGINESHGKGIALQLNTLLDAGAVFEKDGRFAVEPTKIKLAPTPPVSYHHLQLATSDPGKTSGAAA